MKTPMFSKLALGTLIIFACSAIPAFAQRGGGSHGGGGGFHGGGGGGFHGRGGSFGGGGGFRSGASAPPRMGGGYSGRMSSAPRAAGGSYARSVGSGNRLYSSPANGNQRTANSFSAPRGVVNGQWPSFSGASVSRGAAVSPSEARGSANSGRGWQAFGGNRSATAGTARVMRSFSGQGSNVWENGPMARNVVLRSQALSNIHGSFTNSIARGSGLRSNAYLSPTSRLAAGSAFGNRIFSGSPVSNSFLGPRGGVMFGNSLNGFRRGFRGGCWNCGFGFGFGDGWWPSRGFRSGWPRLGFWNWGPYWYDPWWGWPGYGYYGYPAALDSTP